MKLWPLMVSSKAYPGKKVALIQTLRANYTPGLILVAQPIIRFLSLR